MITPPIPKAPFYGYRILKDIRLEDVFSWVNKKTLFGGQWKFRQGSMVKEEHEEFLREKVEPIFKKWTERCIREKILEPRAIYGYYPCYSEGDDLVVLDETGKKEKVRFTFARQQKSPFLCLSDYFRSKKSGETDVLGVQAVTMGPQASRAAQKLFESDQYTDYLYLHGLSVESAEALAECVHAIIRRDLNIHMSDSESKEELFRKKYQGCRYSFGYPACPNLEDQKKLFELIPAEKIGVTLTEEYLLVPEQSTSAIVMHHPHADYFNV
jgi:5-methyltetrahydrofolate--homocysteine methyltransferase